MDDKKFNLLDEPWICVMKENGEVKELSLTWDAKTTSRMYSASFWVNTIPTA